MPSNYDRSKRDTEAHYRALRAAAQDHKDMQKHGGGGRGGGGNNSGCAVLVVAVLGVGGVIAEVLRHVA